MSKNGWKGFVNIELAQVDKKKIRENLVAFEDFGHWAEVTTAEGYKISISFDQERDCFVATLTSNDPDNDNYGYSMSQRHSHLQVALTALVYAHDTKAGGAWASFDKSKQLKFDW